MDKPQSRRKCLQAGAACAATPESQVSLPAGVTVSRDGRLLPENHQSVRKYEAAQGVYEMETESSAVLLAGPVFVG